MKFKKAQMAPGLWKREKKQKEICERRSKFVNMVELRKDGQMLQFGFKELALKFKSALDEAKFFSPWTKAETTPASLFGGAPLAPPPTAAGASLLWWICGLPLVLFSTGASFLSHLHISVVFLIQNRILFYVI